MILKYNNVWQQGCENEHRRRNSDWLSCWNQLDCEKVVKENFVADPSSDVMNYVKFTAVMAGSIALKHYLQDQKILPGLVWKNNLVYKMASIAIMMGGAVLNVAALTGGNYLAKYLAGDDGKAALEEKTWHDKALEAYQAAMEKYTRERTQLLDCIETNREIKDQAKQNFKHRLRVQAL